MSKAIIVCTTLTYYVRKALEKAGKDYPVVEIDNRKHARPEVFWRSVFEQMECLPEEIDTVLLGMGVCGAAAVGWPVPRRTVLPRVDDCITLLLHRDDQVAFNRKEAGHFYLTEEQDLMSIERMREELVQKYGERRAARVMQVWFDGYRSVDMVDTELSDTRCAAAEERLRREAAVIGVPGRHVPGSGYLLDKLLAGRWDEQFIVLEKGQALEEEMFTIHHSETCAGSTGPAPGAWPAGTPTFRAAHCTDA